MKPAKGTRFSVRTASFMVLMSFALVFAIVVSVAFYQIGSQQISRSVTREVQHLIGNVGMTCNQVTGSVIAQICALTESSQFYLFRYSINNHHLDVRPKDYIALSTQLDALYNQNKHIIESLFLYVDDGSIMRYLGEDSLKSIHFSFDELYDVYGDQRLVWMDSQTQDVFETIDTPSSALRLIYLIGDPASQVHGVLLIHIRTDYFVNIFSSQFAPPGSKIFLLNGTSWIVSGDGEEWQEQTYLTPLIGQAPSLDGIVQVGTQEWMLYLHSVDQSDLSVLLAIPIAQMHMDVASFSIYILFAALLMILLGALLLLLLTHWLNQPLECIIEKITWVSQGHLNTEFNVSGFKEVQQLNESAQKLTNSINDLLNCVYREQKSKRRAELSALQSQIDPHFLYNTLYAVQQLCLVGENQLAAQMVHDLATFYRIGISKGKTRIPLREEICHVTSYLQIQKIRYQDTFSYNIDIPEEFESIMILKLTLQPLVENALYHGIRPKRMPGNICITAECVNHNLCITVADDGVGMSDEQVQSLRETLEDYNAPAAPVSYGLKNVHQRLHIAFGGDAGVRINSCLGNGTEMQVIVPMKFEEVQ